ncbi:hypothetical protein PSHT_11658 [Puccinia striiformis]|uniref:Uncharacterized protein n=1 Tax=Puccinia striiformis TaxID=27350 RepID=A0A2S4V1Z9_9BASI|nr:hypothetical protein PSHT_11658 [Puccinia striiformis]
MMQTTCITIILCCQQPSLRKRKRNLKEKQSRTAIDVVNDSDKDPQVSNSETPASPQNSRGKPFR